ncbi:MAG: 16S rRNA (cytosine(1402)-N(4))-methyltransferase RsmH [Pseudomonadota bacterium]
MADRKDLRPPDISELRDAMRCLSIGRFGLSPEVPGVMPTRAAHDPVMLDEMLSSLAVRPGGLYLDATFGVGGYSRAILAAGGSVLAIDRDPTAVARGRELAEESERFTIVQGRFGDVAHLLANQQIDQLDGAVFDLGVCSTQLDDAARGFSFSRSGPLDMRMSASGLSAADVVNHADEATLASILYRYGEERASRRIARAIVEQRQKAAIETTGELASLIAGVLGRRHDRIDPATRSFQALRIEVNDELGELERTLAAMPDLLAPGARLVVVSFHSLEDRLVKRFLSEHGDRRARPSRHLPDVPDRPQALFRVLSSRAIRPAPSEIATNPRARSARLRVAERLPKAV